MKEKGNRQMNIILIFFRITKCQFSSGLLTDVRFGGEWYPMSRDESSLSLGATLTRDDPKDVTIGARQWDACLDKLCPNQIPLDVWRECLCRYKHLLENATLLPFNSEQYNYKIIKNR